MIRSPSVKLSSGYYMPIFGMGTNKLSNSKESIDLIKSAIKNGYRMIDTATLYQNEAEIGEAIKQCISEGIIKREELFIVTKIWPIDNSPELVRDALTRSLTLLQSNYIDLYLIHWPVKFIDQTKRSIDDHTFNYFPMNESDKIGYSSANIIKVWFELERLVTEGKIRSIGVSNFSIKKLLHLLNFCRIKPVVNQVECHPYFKQNDLLVFCENHKIKLMAYFPLGGCREIEGCPKLLDNPTIVDIAKKYNKTPAQICLRWGIERGEIVIPKSSNLDRLIENGCIFDFKISDDDTRSINQINIKIRLLFGQQFYPPGANIRKVLWDE